MTTSCRRLQAVGSTTNETRPHVDTGCDVNDDIRGCGRLLTITGVITRAKDTIFPTSAVVLGTPLTSFFNIHALPFNIQALTACLLERFARFDLCQPVCFINVPKLKGHSRHSVMNNAVQEDETRVNGIAQK